MKMVQKREKMGYKSKVSTAYKTAVASKWLLKEEDEGVPISDLRLSELQL